MPVDFGDVTKQAIQNHQLHWRQTAYSTEPVSKYHAADAILEAYELVQLKPPDRIIWLDSPLAAELTARVLARSGHQNVFQRTYEQPMKFMLKRFEQKCETIQSKQWWLAVQENYPSWNLDSRIITPIRTTLDGWLRQLILIGDPAQVPTAGVYNWPAVFDLIEAQLTAPERLYLRNLKELSLGSLASGWGNFIAPAATMAHGWSNGHGGLDADTFAFLDFVQLAGLPLPDLHGLINLTRHCGWWWAFNDVCILSARPTKLGIDDLGRLHNDADAALAYPDGWRILQRHGAFISDRVIAFGKNPDVGKIFNEVNLEMRRHMIEMFGYEAFIRYGGVKRIAEDEYGTLYRKNFRDDEPLVILKVRNSTPEPDGTHKFYFLRVPPNFRSPKAAVAWTFNVEPKAYNPAKET